MKIGIIASSAKPISESALGGTEVFCALLARGLIASGHSVFLFAPGDTKFPGARHIVTGPRSMQRIRLRFEERFGREMTAEEKKLLYDTLDTRAFMAAKKSEDLVDVFHDNTSSVIGGAFSSLLRKPMVTTMHLPSAGVSPYLSFPSLVDKPSNTFVAISRWQQRHAPVRSRLVYNGIRVSDYRFDVSGGSGLVWLGRFDPTKGVKEAIEVSRKARVAIEVTGYASNPDYFSKEIKPMIKGNVRLVKSLSGTPSKSRYLGSALASIFPINWEEPFGLVFLESMATGTPVIAYARGAAPEVIKDGITGFLVNPSLKDKRGNWVIKKVGPAGLREAVQRLRAMSVTEYAQMRKRARFHAEHVFDIQNTVKGYEETYKSLLK